MDIVLLAADAAHGIPGPGNPILALVALTAMEVVLGIDNIVFLAIVTGRLPEQQQPRARLIGLALAMLMRILLLLTISWIMKLNTPIFTLTGLGLPVVWFSDGSEVNAITGRDIILFLGGLFLIAKSVTEVHERLEPAHGPKKQLEVKATWSSVLFQIVMLDIIFSLDSVITAVGMTSHIWVMIVAVVTAVAIMMVFAGPVSAFVMKHPTLKMLALSFLILIGVMLVAD